MKILITGIAGFIGSNLAKHLREVGDIVGIDDFSTGTPKNLDGIEAKLYEGSILDQSLLARAMSDCSVVIHLAALPSVPRSIADPLRSHLVNATGTVNVLECARTLANPLVIVASSSSVYGANSNLPKSESLVPMPMSPYAVSKLATEQYALAWNHSYGVRTLAFRFFNVYGPNQLPNHPYAAVIPSFIYAALSGQPAQIFGSGLQSRDFTFVGSLCNIIESAILKNVESPIPINLAFGDRTSLLDLLEMLEEITGRRIDRVHRDARTGDVLHSQADSTELQRLFPDTNPVSIIEGLRATVSWMQKDA